MPKTIVREGEEIEDAIRRFKREVSRAGTLVQARKKEFYRKPAEIRKEKERAARKRRFKKRKY